MGTYYYLVLPKNKVLINLGKNVDESSILEIADKINLYDLDEDIYLDEININNFDFEELHKLLKLAKLGELWNRALFDKAVFVYYYSKYVLGEDVFVISEYDEEFKKYSKWKIIDFVY